MGAGEDRALHGGERKVILCALALTQTPDLKHILQEVRKADAYRYAAKDDKGHTLDCLKIVEVGPSRYLGVYHSMHEGVFHLRLAESKDLLNWTWRRDLDSHAHQGTLAGHGDSYVLAYEKDGPKGNWIRLQMFD